MFTHWREEKGQRRMRANTAVISLGLILVSCASAPPGKQETVDQRFEALAKDYLEQMLRMRPEQATALGDHRFDTQLTDYSPEAEQRRLSLNHATLKALEQIPRSELS